MVYGRFDSTRKTKTILGLSLAAAVLLVLEVASRLFLLGIYRLPLWPPGEPAYRFYGGLEQVHRLDIARDDGEFDVLLLGASVLKQVAPVLEQRLQERFGPHVRVHNVCGSGHTSLDSVYKYRHLREKQFDLVLLYHAINELRTNNASPEEFREDYSHYAWYEILNLLEGRHGLQQSGLYLTLRIFWIEVKERLGLKYYVPRHVPMDGKMHHGDDIRSRGPFRRNLESIVRMANERGDPLMLMTFATYVPADYTHQRFLDRELDYFDYELPIRLWGFEDNVVRGIRVHNAVLREVSASTGTPLLDQEHLLPKDGRLFIDICHLSPEGIDLFVSNILDTTIEGDLPRAVLTHGR